MMIRYPGGKTRLKTRITEKLRSLWGDEVTYVEPFVGGGSMFFHVLSKIKPEKSQLNDIDKDLSNLWKAIRDHPDELVDEVESFEPSVKTFEFFSKKLREGHCENIVQSGFMKLAVHQMSFSGLGLKSGGPLGGKGQKSKYKIDCRWSPKNIVKYIRQYSTLMQGTSISAKDFRELLTENLNSVIYLDPPYYAKGGEMYVNSFNERDHIELAGLLKSNNSTWLLSYDDSDTIRELYGEWCNIECIYANYTINTSRKKRELLIWKK